MRKPFFNYMFRQALAVNAVLSFLPAVVTIIWLERWPNLIAWIGVFLLGGGVAVLLSWPHLDKGRPATYIGWTSLAASLTGFAAIWWSDHIG